MVAGPAGFAGAGRAMYQYLESLSLAGIESTVVSFDRPVASLNSCSSGITWKPAAEIESNAAGPGRAIPSLESLAEWSIAEALLGTEVDEAATVVVWAHYLFPYAQAGKIAVETLRSAGRRAQLWLTPCGSDIWEVTAQLPACKSYIRGLLNTADAVVVYSAGFLREVQAILNVELSNAHVVAPPIDFRRFRPGGIAEREALRRRLGLPTDAYVVVHHSNMRPIKRPDLVLASFRRFRERHEANAALVMIGPSDQLSEAGACLDGVHWTGVIEDVAPLLGGADAWLNASMHDSFCLALVEAAACGLSVVSTDRAQALGLLGSSPTVRSVHVSDANQTDNDLIEELARALAAVARLGKSSKQSPPALAELMHPLVADKLGSLIRA